MQVSARESQTKGLNWFWVLYMGVSSAVFVDHHFPWRIAICAFLAADAGWLLYRIIRRREPNRSLLRCAGLFLLALSIGRFAFTYRIFWLLLCGAVAMTIVETRLEKRYESSMGKPMPGEQVVLLCAPAELLSGLPMDEQKAVSDAVGKQMLLVDCNEDGKALLRFTDLDGGIHFVNVQPALIKPAKCWDRRNVHLLQSTYLVRNSCASSL